ncbi:hypothetical protein Pelo_4195 [Pelomyxa schiedti]|nr:hypothetical protein Pelo_4195 [Pelomyxa schiedti]
MYALGIGKWNTIGTIRVDGDTVRWVPPDGCGSQRGRIASLEPSLQVVAGDSRVVCWAFQVTSFPRPGCQEGFGACTSLIGINLKKTSHEGSGYFPVTCPELCIEKNAKSFGVSLGGFIQPRIMGSRTRPGTVCRLGHQACTRQDDVISFFLRFVGGSKKQAGTLQVFHNNQDLLFRVESVDTSQPLFPTVNMCCVRTAYTFLRNPPIPPSLRW